MRKNVSFFMMVIFVVVVFMVIVVAGCRFKVPSSKLKVKRSCRCYRCFQVVIVVNS
jgi:hypothetical protein